MSVNMRYWTRNDVTFTEIEQADISMEISSPTIFVTDTVVMDEAALDSRRGYYMIHTYRSMCEVGNPYQPIATFYSLDKAIKSIHNFFAGI